MGYTGQPIIFKRQSSEKMHSLITYINSIHKQTTPVSIIDKSTKTNSYIDDEIEVNETETTYYFDNGVMIRHKTEQDNAPSDQLCEECWISYEVVEPGEQQISPLRKTFCNACQEAFWLKMQR